MDADSPDDMTMDGKRSVKRARVLLAAKLRTAAGEVDVRLRDLSQKGALIELTQPLLLGDEVVFTRGKTIVSARVAWAGGNRAGLEFHQEIDESEVLVHVARPASNTSQQRFRRPRVLSEDISEQERRLARVWAKSVGIAPPR